MGKNKLDTVYYYCKPQVFENIIEHQEIWLCDMVKTNDYKEIHHVLEGFEEIIKADNWFSTTFTKEQKKLFLMDFQKICGGLIKKYCWLAICFTTQEDSLAQWRTYGFNGKGFAIGFDYGKLDELEGTQIEKMKYAEKTDISYVHNQWSSLKPMLKFYYDQGAISSSGLISKTTRNKIFKLLEDAINEMCTWKSPAFSYEQEYRSYVVMEKEAIRQSVRKNKNSDDEKGCYGVSVKERDVVIYKRIKIDPDMIKKVVIGPRNGAKKEEIELLLTLNGFDIDKDHIIKSAATYRS